MEVVGSLMSLVFLGSLSFGTAIEALQVCKYTFALINLQREPCSSLSTLVTFS